MEEGNVNMWALLVNEEIVDVIATVGTQAEVANQYPNHQVTDLYSLPLTVRKRYRYWNAGMSDGDF